jgi:hypothetical protein
MCYVASTGLSDDQYLVSRSFQALQALTQEGETSCVVGEFDWFGDQALVGFEHTKAIGLTADVYSDSIVKRRPIYRG